MEFCFKIQDKQLHEVEIKFLVRLPLYVLIHEENMVSEK